MILDSVQNLNRIHSVLSEFLKREEVSLRIEAVSKGSPEPYSEFLPYIELVKSQGKVLVNFDMNRGLLISGSIENLTKYIEAFEFSEDEDGNHHHPDFSLINENTIEMNGLWPFIEADNDYVAEHLDATS